MLRFTSPACSAAALLLACGPVYAGTFNFRGFTGDADSSIDPNLVYTARADFLGDGMRTVNTVKFLDTGLTGTNYMLTGADGTFPNFDNNVTGASNALLRDFVYGATSGAAQGNAALTLSDLVIGRNYVTTFYNASFGNVGERNVTITADDTNTSIVFDENFTGTSPSTPALGAGNGNLLRYAFTATAPTITYTFDAVSNGDSFHHYAFSNAEQTMVFSTPVITAQTHTPGDPVPFTPFTPSNTDLLQTQLLGTTSGGDFTTEGGGGVGVLTDGTFSINGGNPANNSPLATGHNGAFVEYTLDTSMNVFGYDISSIETYGGWNDAGRDRQSFSISYSLIDSDAFVDFGSIAFNPAAGTDSSAVRAIFPSTLSGVDAIRFDFPTGQENGYAGYGEFDVIGLATIPEPTTLAIVALGGAGLLGRRRRGGGTR